MPVYTANQISQLIDRSSRQVRRIAAQHNIGSRHASGSRVFYLFSGPDLRRIRSVLRNLPESVK